MKILHIFIIILAGFTSTFVGKAPCLLAKTRTGPARALYKATLPENPHPKLVKSVEIAVAPGQPTRRWYRLACTKLDGDCFTIWFLADANPFSPNAERTVNFSRYILQEPGQPPI
jgi:hypothetical protein